jgi:hypothetical protein
VNPKNNWTPRAAAHSLRHRLEEGAFITGRCAYCGLDTIDFCPECNLFVCRRCDRKEHWPAVGIFPDVGFVVAEYFGGGRRGGGRRR